MANAQGNASIEPTRVDLEERHGWGLFECSGLKFWTNGYGDVSNPAKLANQVRGMVGGPSLENFLEVVRRLDGHFAFVVQGEGWACATVDRVRSIPLAYGKDEFGWRIDGRAERLRRALGLTAKNADELAALALGMSGYTIDNATLYPDVSVLGPWELIFFNGVSPPERERYYCYRPWRQDKPVY